ncbi:nucleotide exchange factor GrpE [Caloramator proteoclasticus]|uniref:Protein GrpE n=1 Tax=Caloramator proteoclasticus DSM 10124 TaxID=1121262 RepID=A0A1M4WY48_9CLOT|nr:nucleotide exchange factor GrpE [Caloramator proteoclasticus]SHE86174.1 molecular chaperone GrpE [Caloramator proteoclasticus DSM 10124]
MTEEIKVNENELEKEEKEAIIEKIEDLESEKEVNNDINDENKDELIDIKNQLDEKTKECNEYLELLRRTKAEFDNYRRRTQKEKETIYEEGFADAIKNILPILDNLERAVISTEERTPLYEGVEMTLKLFKDTLTKLGIEEIPALNEKFDPNFHNAVMHIEDENLEENVIVEVFQKGYKYKEKILRYSMVKVAN